MCSMLAIPHYKPFLQIGFMECFYNLPKVAQPDIELCRISDSKAYACCSHTRPSCCLFLIYVPYTYLKISSLTINWCHISVNLFFSYICFSSRPGSNMTIHESVFTHAFLGYSRVGWQSIDMGCKTARHCDYWKKPFKFLPIKVKIQNCFYFYILTISNWKLKFKDTFTMA